MIVPDLSSLNFQPKAFLSGSPGPWAGHLPFAYDLVTALRPSTIVELGVHYGDSYFGFCQAIAENSIPCTCYGVDTWRGDPHGGFYENAVYEAVSRHNETTYAPFSYLLRSTFDHAVEQFSEESIDLLHIDGYHTYDAVRQDFDKWFPKVRPGGIVLMHDIVERSSDFGVWRLWDELQRRYPTFTFCSSHGLGVLRKPSPPERDDYFLENLFASSDSDRERIRSYYNLCARRMHLEMTIGNAQVKEAGHSMLQVFSSHADQYLPEADGNRLLDANKRLKVTVALPRGLGTRPLRIDPSNRPGVIEITSIILRKLNGSPLWNWHAGEEANLRVEGTAFRVPSQESLRIRSYGIDPQVYLPDISDGTRDDALELEICMQIDLEFGITRHLLEENRQRENALKDLQAELAQSYEARLSCIEQQNIEREDRLERGYAELEQGYRFQLHSLQEQNAAALKEMEQVRQRHLSLIVEREQVYNLNALLSQDLASAQQEIQTLGSEQSMIKTVNENCKTELDRFSVSYERSKAEFAHLSAAYENCKTELDQISAAYENCKTELDRISAVYENCKTKLDRISAAYENCKTELESLKVAYHESSTAFEVEKQIRFGMEHSRSWKITRPLRTFAAFFRKSPQSD